MINLLVAEQFAELIAEDLLTRAAEIVLKQDNVEPDTEMSVVIEDDEHLRALNQQFRDINEPTDVLSFPADEFDPDSNMRYIGDVIISYPKALEQAAAASEKIEDEIQLLVVHGTLHLLGYDHGDDEEKQAMWRAQQAALDALGCEIKNLPE